MHAGLDVVATGAHLVEARRLERPFVTRTACDRAEAGELVLLAVEVPRLVAVGVFDDTRCEGLRPCRQATLEHVWWLDEMVVDGDDSEVDGPRLGIGQQAIGRGRRHRASSTAPCWHTGSVRQANNTLPRTASSHTTSCRPRRRSSPDDRVSSAS